MPLFFLPYLCIMNRLLLFYDNSGDKYYIPTNNIQRIYRVDSDTVRIVTNLFAHDSNTVAQYLSYDINEVTPSGASDTTQPDAIIDAWAEALRSPASVVQVVVPSVIGSIVTSQNPWV
jgi:hypothetical protein